MDDRRELPVGVSVLSPLPRPLSSLFLPCQHQSGSQQSNLLYRHCGALSILPHLNWRRDGLVSHWSGDCWRQPEWASSVSDSLRAGDERDREWETWAEGLLLAVIYPGVLFDIQVVGADNLFCPHQMHCAPQETHIKSNRHCDTWQRHATENNGLSKK